MRSAEEIKKDIRELLKKKKELQLSLQILDEQYAILKNELFDANINSFKEEEEEKKK